MRAKIAAIAAATGLTIAPVAASASSAASLSVAGKVRASAPAKKGEALGQGGRFLIGGAVVAAIVAGIFIAADQIGSDDPDSN